MADEVFTLSLIGKDVILSFDERHDASQVYELLAEHPGRVQPGYTPVEKQVADYLVNEVFDGQIGAGTDPIGFLIVSHRFLLHELREARKQLDEQRRGSDPKVS